MAVELPAIVGCTASGKTAMALAMAKSRPLEVISADSRQIYRGMNIGTAKPSAAELSRLPHHLIDIVDPGSHYSAGQFVRDALSAAEEIRARGRLPLVVGGTGLYMMALCGGLDDLPVRNDRIRGGLRAAERRSPGLLRRMLERLDSGRAEEIGEADMVRHVRALEIVLQSGQPVTGLRGNGSPPPANLRIAGVRVPLPRLRERITRRNGAMIESGLLTEVRKLIDSGWGRDSALGRTIGYAETIDYLEGLTNIEEARRRMERNTWSLARRQRNIFRRLPGVRWFAPNETEAAEKYLFG